MSNEVNSEQRNLIKSDDFSDLNSSDKIKLFEIYRDYLKHEDNLINWRVTWYLAVQSIISIGFFSFLYNGIIITGSATRNHILILFFVSFVGCLFSWSACISIDAARIAISSIEKRWFDLSKNNVLPGFIGGGDGLAARRGIFFAFSLAVIPPMFMIITILFIMGAY